ncbi:hypothetical protein M9H77_22565 [Catharanthus roseus]|uniref:Uncharacterized protein n=1 Tax=Catharanthus roseus TaxID=4058 RepID=A0ACC0ATD0_CATRO|nr:hypothetical protein M9H77_22565 [Catharanthus roseus]
METTLVNFAPTDAQPPSSIPNLLGSVANLAAAVEPVSKEEILVSSEHVFLTSQMVIVSSAENTSFGNISVPIFAFMADITSSSIVLVSSKPMHVDPIFVSLHTDLSMIGDNPIVLAQVLELLKSHGHVLHSLSGVGSSSQQQALFTKSPARPVARTNVENSGLLHSEGHSDSDLGEKNVTKKIETDIRKAREAKVKAREPPTLSKAKQTIPVLTSSDHRHYIARGQFQELQQQVIALQCHLWQLHDEFTAYKESHH